MGIFKFLSQPEGGTTTRMGRNLTQDFRSCAAQLSKTEIRAPSKQNNRSAFMLAAKQISLDIYRTHEKLEKLAKLASSTSLFNDPVHDIQELTYMIKKDIANLNKKLESVKAMNVKTNKQTDLHNEGVVGNLSLKLQMETKQFRTVLNTRSENYKKQQEFRKQFTAPRNSKGRGDAKQSALYIQDDSSGQLESSASNQAQQLVSAPLRYDGQERLDSIQQIETTMRDLNKIMTDISIMVEEQQVVMERIDTNVSDALESVDTAQQHLFKFLQNVSSDRGLILKMFLILVVFCIIFFMFFV